LREDYTNNKVEEKKEDEGIIKKSVYSAIAEGK
jgi:hypothetical protein